MNELPLVKQIETMVSAKCQHGNSYSILKCLLMPEMIKMLVVLSGDSLFKVMSTICIAFCRDHLVIYKEILLR